jgi:ribosomal protein S18 acetylase RimI-like enzyme
MSNESGAVSVPSMVSIQPAGREDAAAILSLQRLAYLSEAKLYDDDSIPPLVQTLEELSAEFASKLFLKAVEDGALVGSVRGHAREGVAFLERLAVDPACQGRGVGTLLVRSFEASFPGAQRFELFTGHKSERNIALYRRLGYVPFRRERIHPGLEIVYLEKRVG